MKYVVSFPGTPSTHVGVLPRPSTIAAIRRAAQLGLFTEAESRRLIDRLRAGAAAGADQP